MMTDKGEILYMAVTSDKYELPLGVYAYADDAAKAWGMSRKSFIETVSHKRPGKNTGVKFLKVLISKED